MPAAPSARRTFQRRRASSNFVPRRNCSSSSCRSNYYWNVIRFFFCSDSFVLAYGQTVETFSGRFGTFSRPRKKRSSGFWFLLPDFFLVPERKKKLSQKWNNLLRPPQMTGFGTHFDRRRKKNKTENGGDDFPNYRIAPGNNGRSVYTLNTDQQ